MGLVAQKEAIVSFKRGRPKNRRAGCLLCKPWKGNGMHRKSDHLPISERRVRLAEKDQTREVLDS